MMGAQLQSPDFRNVCLPCSHFSPFIQAVEEEDRGSGDWNSKSPCGSQRSSTSSTSSETSAYKTEQTSSNEMSGRISTMEPIEPSVLNVGATAQLRRKNSSVSRERRRRRSIQVTSTQHGPIEEWSETFVAQDGVLTTNFCSTEL